MTDLARPPQPPPAARFLDPDADDFSLVFDLYSDLLPDGSTAKVRAWTGHGEAALLRSMKAEGPAKVDHLVTFLQNVLAELNGGPPSPDAILDLHDASVRAIQIRARAATHDDSTMLVFGWDCAPPAVPRGMGCGHRGSGPTPTNGRPINHQGIDLAKLPFLPMVVGSQRQLPSSKKVAAWFPNTLRRQKQYLASHRQAQAGDDGVDLDALFLARGVQLDGKVGKRADFEALPGKDRSALRADILKWGGVDTRTAADAARYQASSPATASALSGAIAAARATTSGK